MLNNPYFETAQKLLTDIVRPVGTETAALEFCSGRILAHTLTAEDNIPPFDRSPYDGFAFRSRDTLSACPEHPVSLQILEEVPAGFVPSRPVTADTAVKVMTGAPIPDGADAVCRYEETRFTRETVALLHPYPVGINIVRSGEDVKRGQVLAPAGTRIDAGLSGIMAAQGIVQPEVFRIPKIGLISTGSEIVPAAETPLKGQIRDSNCYALAAALVKDGFQPVFLGLAGDLISDISRLLLKGVDTCDAVILTGGVSAGDYDLTPSSMEQIGASMLIRGVAMKPGMACAYAMKDGRLIAGLSGNPASALTNYYAVLLPALRRLAGRAHPGHEKLTLTLSSRFEKKSRQTRLLRGRLHLSDGTVQFILPPSQGNAVLSSAVGCNAMAVIPAGSGPQEAGTRLEGFLL